MIDTQAQIPHNAAMKVTSYAKIGDRVAELSAVAGATAREVAEATGIPYSKLSKWKGDLGERPEVWVSEAWTLAHFFGSRLSVEPHQIMRYLIDDDQPDGLAVGAVQKAWGERLEGAAREPEPVEIVAERRGVPIPKRASRTNTKRKNLPS